VIGWALLTDPQGYVGSFTFINHVIGYLLPPAFICFAPDLRLAFVWAMMPT
jgi:hypothetical protein